MKNLKENQIKTETEDNSEAVQTENYNFESVTVKGEPIEDEDGLNYFLQNDNIAKTEAEDKDDNVVLLKEYDHISSNIETQEENGNTDGAMQVDEELKYKFVDVIIKEEPQDNYNEIYTKPEFDDSKNSSQNETTTSEYIPPSDPVINKCLKCHQIFAQPWQLMLHNHMQCNDKPYKCDMCEKAFADHSALARHKKSHSDEKPYQCDLCHKSFKQSGHLAGHKQTHSGIRAHKCDICGKAFGRTDRLTAHKRTHTGEKPFKCDVCEKAFNDNSILIRHIRTHFIEKPFKCDECGKTFSENNYLTKHKRTHSGERPFPCDMCGKAFRQSAHLIGHKKTHGYAKGEPKIE